MNNNPNTFGISNEHVLLINILNSMYNDNLRQINNITETFNNLNRSNNQIRNLLVQLLNSPQTSRTSRRNGIFERRYRENNDRNVDPNSNRVFINNTPYIIDSITEQTIPRNAIFQSLRNAGMNNIVTSDLENIFNNFMQPVEVYPTQSQIESATRRVRYCDISRPINTQCPISMDEFNDSDMVTVIRHCGHIFETDHLINWFRSNCRCPVCRYDIRDYNSNASTEFFSGSRRNNANANMANASPNETGLVDSSNNNAERNFINRMDSIGSGSSIGITSNNDSYSRVLNDTLNNISDFTDLSGNSTDNMLAGAALLMTIINNSNQMRNFR